jgi:bifunctional N-acetylglucosamine-1-phosphate-uridyltransferase/glucosamine-1-phosphate-acetyltransferase GlmU-like protein
MKSEVVKVLHPILGLPMLSYPIALSINGIKAEKTIVVVGYQADQIKERFKNTQIQFVEYKENGDNILATANSHSLIILSSN